jgi:hypothetical protein
VEGWGAPAGAPALRRVEAVDLRASASVAETGATATAVAMAAETEADEAEEAKEAGAEGLEPQLPSQIPSTWD